MTNGTTRRTVLVTGTAVALAAACSEYGNGNDGASDTTTDSTSKPGSQSPSESPSQAPGGGQLTRTGDIPEGGGKIFKDQKVVVTQPQRGEFKAFSAVCTHMGCIVSSVANGTIDCACHGSEFHIADGSVARGPATKPLPEEKITVSGDSIRLT